MPSPLPISVRVTSLRSPAIAIALWLLMGLGLLVLGPASAHAHAGHAAQASEVHDAPPLDMVLLTAVGFQPLMLDASDTGHLSRQQETGPPCPGACCAGLQCCAMALAGDLGGLQAPPGHRQQLAPPPHDWAARDRQALPRPPRPHA